MFLTNHSQRYYWGNRFHRLCDCGLSVCCPNNMKQKLKLMTQQQLRVIGDLLLLLLEHPEIRWSQDESAKLHSTAIDVINLQVGIQEK